MCLIVLYSKFLKKKNLHAFPKYFFLFYFALFLLQKNLYLSNICYTAFIKYKYKEIKLNGKEESCYFIIK